MKKVLVTGGKGFLGSYLVNRLQSEGCEMRILARPHHDTPKSELNDPSIIWGDLCDSEVVDRAVAGMDKVIYTISNFRHGGSDKDVRTQSMSRVLKMS